MQISALSEVQSAPVATTPPEHVQVFAPLAQISALLDVHSEPVAAVPPPLQVHVFKAHDAPALWKPVLQLAHITEPSVVQAVPVATVPPVQVQVLASHPLPPSL